MRETAPQIHSSIMTSPMTTMRRPAMRASNSLAVGGAIISSPMTHDPLGRFEQRLRAKIRRGAVVGERTRHENPRHPKPLTECDITATVADDGASRKFECMIAHRTLDESRRGLATVAPVVVV